MLRVGGAGFEDDEVVFSEEALDGGFFIDEGHDDVVVLSGILLADEDEVFFTDPGAVHGIAGGPEEEVVEPGSGQLRGDVEVGLDILDGEEGDAAGGGAEEGNFDGGAALIGGGRGFRGGGQLEAAFSGADEVSGFDEAVDELLAGAGGFISHGGGEFPDGGGAALMEEGAPEELKGLGLFLFQGLDGGRVGFHRARVYKWRGSDLKYTKYAKRVYLCLKRILLFTLSKNKLGWISLWKRWHPNCVAKHPGN